MREIECVRATFLNAPRRLETKAVYTTLGVLAKSKSYENRELYYSSKKFFKNNKRVFLTYNFEEKNIFLGLSLIKQSVWTLKVFFLLMFFVFICLKFGYFHF